jgi:hypothetical protein
MSIRSLLLMMLLSSTTMIAQNLPDRTVVLDPLARMGDDTAAFVFLGGTHLYAEFGRYDNASGDGHRWNAKTGGFFEVARWDSSTSIAFVGTTEVVMDPLNDIAFNPRAIFWEEGVVGTFALGDDGLRLQAGYVHRCKHDIDNLEIRLIREQDQQRTLIYSGLMTRLILPPLRLLDGPAGLSATGNIRNDFFMHLLDSRLPDQDVGRNLETLIDALNLGARLDLELPGGRIGGHLAASFMLTFAGRERGFSERFSDVALLGSLPFAELGLDFVNPRGGSLTLFLRGEWQRDDGIAAEPKAGRLVLFGVRVE